MKPYFVLFLAGAAGAVLVAGCGSSGGASKTESSTATAPQTSAATRAAPSTTAKPTSAAKPSPTARTRDNASAKVTRLGSGSFIVGQDVPAGRYVITPASGQSGNISAETKDDPTAINEVLGRSYGFGVPSVTSSLAKGEKIKISGLSKVTFTPAVTKLRTVLGSGDWQVGLDIAAGRYVATPAKKESGNFAVYATDGFPDTNEILGKAQGVGVPNVTVSLKDNQKINISGISAVNFAKK